MIPPLPLLSAAGWSVLTGVVTTLAGLATSVLIARSLGPSAMGHYSYWIWVVGVVPALFGFGLLPATVKFSAELLGRGDPRLASAVVLAIARVQGGLSATLAAVLLLLGVVGAAGIGLDLYGLVAALVVFGGLGGVLGSAIKGAMDYRFSTELALLTGLLQLALFGGALLTGAGLRGLLAVMVVCSAVGLALTVYRFRRIYPTGESGRMPAGLRADIVRYCRSLTALGLLDAVVWSRSEVLFLGLFAGADQIAFYSLAYGIAGRLTMAATLITHPMLPAFAGLHANGELPRMNRIYRTAMRYVTLSTAPLALGAVLFAEPLVTLLYGEQYAEAAPVLVITALSSLAGALTLVCSAVLYAIGRPDVLVRLNVGLALANIAAAVVLIPRYGAVGAAIANAVGPLVTVVAVAIVLHRGHGLAFPARATARILAAAGGAVLVAWLTVPGTGIGSFLAALGVALPAYALALLLGRVLDHKEDRAVLAGLGRILPLRWQGYYARVVQVLT